MKYGQKGMIRRRKFDAIAASRDQTSGSVAVAQPSHGISATIAEGVDGARLPVYIQNHDSSGKILFFKRLTAVSDYLRSIPGLLRHGLLAVAVVLLAAPAVQADLPRVDTGLPLSMGTVPQGTSPAGGAPQGQTEQALPPSAATGQRGVQLRSNLLEGKTLQAGPTFDYRPNAPHPELPLIATHGDNFNPVEVGGFVGYLFHDDASGLPTGSLGFNLQVATDPKGSTSGWLLQPGVDYSTALALVVATQHPALLHLFAGRGSNAFGAGGGTVIGLRCGRTSPASRTLASGLGSAIPSPTAGTSRRRPAISGCWERASLTTRANPRRTSSSAA